MKLPILCQFASNKGDVLPFIVICMNLAFENEFLFLVSRQNFQEEHKQTADQLAANPNLNWEYILSAAEAHGVAPIFYWNYLAHSDNTPGISKDISNKFKQNIIQHIFLKEKRDGVLIDALEYFNQRNIPVMLSKAAALDHLVYEKSWFTISQDIDLILRRRKDEFSQEEIRDLVKYLNKTGIEFDFYTHHDTTMNGVLPVDFDRIWKDSVPLEVAGYPVFVMSPEDMLISICINACRKRYFRLKSLFDIAETVNVFKDRLDWKKLIQNACSDGCHPIIFTALLVTDKTLGCQVPEMVWTSLKLHSFRKKAIQAVLDWLLPNIALFPYPFEGQIILGRPLHKSLVLTFLSYQNLQIWRKMVEIVSAWRNPNPPSQHKPPNKHPNTEFPVSNNSR